MRALGASRTSVAPGGVLAGNWARDPLWKNARAVPSLDLRFAENKSLTDAKTGASLVTFTRASTGTYVGADGLVKTATTNEARFDHNPTTGESLGLLVEEARTNLISYSEDFSAWTQTGASITVDSATAPDATTTADLWTNTASPGIVHQVYTKDTVARTYTGSLWVKPLTGSGLTAFTISVDDGTTLNRGRAIFNLNTGAYTSVINDGTFTNTSGTITRYPNNWYRLTVTTTTSTATTLRLRPFFSTTGGTVNVWGAQLEEGAFATSYIPTTTATATRAADVASVTGANFGVTRTNYIRNNTMVGAVVGTPGTLPTNWGTAGGAALSTQIIGTGTDNGINYIDVRCFGTTAAVASPEIYFNFDVATAIPVAQNQTWTTSCYAKIVGGTQTGIIGGELYVLGLNSSSGLTEAAPANFNYSSLTGAFSTCRVSKTHTFTVATTVYSQLRIDVNFTAGGGTAVDFTLRIGMPQMEVGSVATAAIPTTTAAASVFESSWYNQTEGTIFVEAALNGRKASTAFVQIQDATATDRIQLRQSSDSLNVLAQVVDGASAGPGLASTAFSLVSQFRIALAVKASDHAASINGGSIGASSTPATMPTVDQLTFAPATGSSAGTIKRLTYWPVRLANTTLQAITQ